MHYGEYNNIVKMKNYIEDYTLVCIQLSAYAPFIMAIELILKEIAREITACKEN